MATNQENVKLGTAHNRGERRAKNHSGAHNMTAYYNEFNPKAAAMLRQLIKDGLIAPGDVDERSIEDVRPDDLKPYTQCHFFAGIGGWSVALRLAGWPDDRPVWTGSCPCQPFSTAGKGKGKADERHLWPMWFRLIRESRPPVVYGEQVSAAIRHGWWDDVADDLEGEGYATRAEIRPASSVGKPHKRDRLWFVADAPDARLQERRSEPVREPRPEQEPERHGTMGNAEHDGWDWRQGREVDGGYVSGGEEGAHRAFKPTRASQPVNVANAARKQQHGGYSGFEESQYEERGEFIWISCPDGKSRPVEPSICLLAHGVQHRAPILHAFGNAIVPQVAAEFIGAFIDVTNS